MPKVSSHIATLIFPCPNCKTIVSTQDVDVFGECPECQYDFEEVGDD